MNTSLDRLKQHILVDGFELVADLKKSKGSYMHDALTGKRFLDMYTYFASLPMGHNHPMMFESDFLEELQRAAIANPANSDVYTEEFAGFVEAFTSFCGKDFRSFFFVGGGAVAVENALKTAFDWKAKKNQTAGIAPERDLCVIHFEEAFHGRTGYAMSVSSANAVHTDGFPQFKWPRVLNPKIKFPLSAENLGVVQKAEDAALSQIESALSEFGASIAAVIIEPVQGEGGDNHFRGEFLAKLKEIADENDLLLIFDEVQTGFGLTGKLWAYEHSGVVPDILVFGKKTQVCGIMAGDKVAEVSGNVFTKSGRINSTWGGSLVDMVRCKQYINIMKKENALANAGRAGSYIVKRLHRLEEEHPGRISNVRGLGLMIAFDLQDKQTRDTMRKEFWEEGVIVLPSGKTGLRLRPALTISVEESDAFADICSNVASKVFAA